MSNNLSSIGVDSVEFLHREASRPFGAVFLAQNPVYLLYLPLFLLLSAIVIWLLPSNETFVLGSAIGTAVALYILVDIVFRAAPLRFTMLQALAVMVGYDLGTLNSWLTLPRADLTLAEYFASDPEALARAIAASLAASGLMLALGQIYERPIFGEDFRIDFDNRSVVLVVLSTLLIVVAFATGQLGYMGISPDVNGHVNPAAALIIWWSVPAFAYSVCASLNTAGGARLLVTACAIVQGVLLVPVGRRQVGYAMLLALISLRLGRYRSHMSQMKKLMLGIVAAGLIAVASIAFVYLRAAGFGHKGFIPITTRLSLTLETLEKRDLADVARLVGNDAATRNDIGFFSNILDGSQRSTPLLGRDLIENLQTIVPSAFSGNKSALYGEEKLVDMQWNFSYIDEANTLLTAGAADFGIIGAVLYPLFAVLLLRWAIERLQFVMPIIGSVVIALAFIQQMVITEQSPVDVFQQIRNALIFTVLVYVISILPKFSLRGGSAIH